MWCSMADANTPRPSAPGGDPQHERRAAPRWTVKLHKRGVAAVTLTSTPSTSRPKARQVHRPSSAPAQGERGACQPRRLLLHCCGAVQAGVEQAGRASVGFQRAAHEPPTLSRWHVLDSGHAHSNHPCHCMLAAPEHRTHAAPSRNVLLASPSPPATAMLLLFQFRAPAIACVTGFTVGTGSSSLRTWRAERQLRATATLHRLPPTPALARCIRDSARQCQRRHCCIGYMQARQHAPPLSKHVVPLLLLT